MSPRIIGVVPGYKKYGKQEWVGRKGRGHKKVRNNGALNFNANVTDRLFEGESLLEVKLADKPEKLDDRYTLWEKIASGGMAEVYRATEYGAKGSRKTVALKKILPNYSSNPDYRKMFADEAIICTQLTHANICQVNPLLEIGDNLYMPMEFVDGKNLRQIITKYKKRNGSKPLPIPFSLHVISEVSKGLEYAHSKIGNDDGRPLNIVHRDMSPQNIMISYEGAVKLIDFGIAKSKILANETRAGVIKGKYSYMSPEQTVGGELNRQSDLFSIGIILWELLTGERLFQTESELATIKLIQDCDLRNKEPIKKNPAVTPELNKIVMKALTKDLSLRYKSADLFQQQLQRYNNEKYSAYSIREVRRFLENLFSEEISAEQKIAKVLYGATVTNSQQKERTARRGLQEVENALEGSITNTNMSGSTGVTDAELMDDSEKFEDPMELGSKQDKKNEATALDISQNTEVSVEQKDFKIPSIVAEEKMVITREKNTATQGETAEPRPIELILSDREGPLNQKREKSAWDIVSVGSNSSKEIGLNKVRLDTSLSEEIEKANSISNSQNSNISVVKQSQKWLGVAVVVAFVGTAYLYQLIFTGKMTSIFNEFSKRGPTANPSIPVMEPSLPIKTNSVTSLCQVKVETDPPGATIIGEGFAGSSSTGIILAPCDQSVILRLEKPGYEPYKIPVVTNKQQQVVPMVTLQLLRGGTIVITVDNNSQVLIDGKSYGEIKANIPAEYFLPAGTHKFLFKNGVFGVSAEQDFKIIESQKIVTRTIKLLDNK